MQRRVWEAINMFNINKKQHSGIKEAPNNDIPAARKSIKQSIIKRVYNIKERLYIEAKYLADYGFGIGQPIKYCIDKDTQSITVMPAESGSERRVAKTTQKSGKMVPVIDIKVDEIKNFFAKHNQVQVEIHKGKIIFTVVGIAKSEENHVSIEDFKKPKQQKMFYSVDIGDLAKASCMDQQELYGLFRGSRSNFRSKSNSRFPLILKEKAIRMLSLFSGCGSFDRGFLDEGYDIIFANDRYEDRALKDYHIRTYRRNIGNHIIMKDVIGP
jgi:hypothetical protein